MTGSPRNRENGVRQPLFQTLFCGEQRIRLRSLFLHENSIYNEIGILNI